MSSSPYDYLGENELMLWDNAEQCKCQDDGCEQNHKLCALCSKTVIFSAYVQCQPNSKYNWNIDHIIPRSKFANLILEAARRKIYSVEDIRNLQITHVSCNNIKGDNFNNDYANGYGRIID